MHIRIVLPAYNEEESLPPLLQRINDACDFYKWDASVLVVNDGSKDNTLGVIRDFKSEVKIEVLDIQPNQGLANAINSGLRKAIIGMKDSDVIVTLDADDSQSPFPDTTYGHAGSGRQRPGYCIALPAGGQDKRAEKITEIL